ncbi:MAG: dihydrodipicolinate synthase family protein [Ruminococcaceae bacterium]|nr:dihydrodipicolinate synthase family protein [Oscillospiraceae bacterium]
MQYTNGFYTALGTPLDENGNLCVSSLQLHIRQQIDVGASGLLLMGSMGIEAYIKNTTYAEIVRIAAEEVAGKLPLFVGVMDNSIVKVAEKIEMIGNAKIDGVVLTTPFYALVDNEQMVNWFSSVADKSPYPVYLYDLAAVTKCKITLPVIDRLIGHPNIKGIKTADWEMIQAIGRKYRDSDFACFYSGLDSFDYANMMGIKKNLDGMFSCTPKNARKMFDLLDADDFTGARKYLDNILLLRDTMLACGLMPSFTYCMNMLGCTGNFHQDYCLPITDASKAKLEDTMKKIGEI